MLSVNTDVTVEWEDCDPAGIVFYPRFLSYFDRGTWNMWLSIGLNRDEMRWRGGFGFPALEAQATFSYPCRFKDRLKLVSEITEIREKFVRVEHTLHNGSHLAVSGYEIRFWGIPHPTDPLRLKAGAIPEDVLAKLK